MTKPKKEHALVNKFRGLDIFGMDQQFNIGGQDKIRTIFGAFMSIMLTCIIVAYGSYRAIKMINIDDTFVQKVTRTGYYDEKDIFTQDQLNFYISYSWDYQSPGSYDRYVNVSLIHKKFEPETLTTFEVIPDRPCTESDIEKHYPLADPKNSFSKESWNCPQIDPDVNLYGDFNAWSSSYLELWVEYCNNATSQVPCASYEEIDEYLTLSYIIVRMNTQSFEELSYDDHISGQTKEDWISVNPKAHLRLNYVVEYQEIEREDEFLQLGQFEKEHLTSTMQASQTPVIAYENYNTISQVIFQMSFNSSIYRRQIYGVLEWFGDLGGVLEAISIIFGVLTVTWAQINLEAALVESLYKVRSQVGPSEQKFVKEQYQKFSFNNLLSLKSQMAGRIRIETTTPYSISTWFKRIFCCDGKEGILRRGYARVEREMDLITFIKDQRQNRAIKRVRADLFDQIFGKHQATNVIDLNYPTSSSGGEEESPDDHRWQYNNMKKVIKARETLTPMDMKLLRGVLHDQSRKIPWDESDQPIPNPNQSDRKSLIDSQQSKKSKYLIDEPFDNSNSLMQRDSVIMSPEQRKIAQENSREKTSKLIELLQQPQESSDETKPKESINETKTYRN